IVILDRGGAGQAVLAVHVHRTGAANTLAAGAAEGQGGIQLALDLDQRIQNHRPGLVEIDLVGIHARVLAAVGIVAVDVEPLGPLRAGCGLMLAPLLFDLAVVGEEILGHRASWYLWCRIAVAKNRLPLFSAMLLLRAG